MEHELTIRLTAFLGILGIMALWEMISPYRQLSVSKRQRWVNNLSLVVLNTIVLRLIFSGGAIIIADITTKSGLGIFNLLNLPYAQKVFWSVIVLDLVIYLQHAMFHALPTLWQLHKVHHADLDFDVTTGLRFHPLEIVLSMGIKLAAIILLGAPMLAVLIFEVVLNATAMFNHGNVSLPPKCDRILRLFLVTPNMHRIHHSINPKETDSNFGFNLPWWDYLFGTYLAHSAKNDQTMSIGLEEYQNNLGVEKLPGMLLLPFDRITN